MCGIKRILLDCILSFGGFLGVWIICAGVSETLFRLHMTYEDGTVFRYLRI